VLLRALDDPDPFVRSKAVEGLSDRPEAERAVMAALDDDYPMVRRSAVRALRGSTRSRAAQALVEVVSHDPSAEVREEAVGVLAEILQRGANQNS
jgi:HEAT repeat protein